MEYQTYVNPNYQQYIKQEIEKLEVDSEFKPFIVDALIRRSGQYALSFEEIQKDIKTLMINLKKIEISDNMCTSWAAGEYNPSTKTITLGANYSRNTSPEILYQTFVHELYHVLSKDEDGKDTLSGDINRYTGQYNSSLLEVLVEKSSYKTVFPTYIPKEQGYCYYAPNYNSRGYNDITFAADLLEASHGSSEQALLRNGHKSRAELAEFLENCTKQENIEDSLDFLDEFESNLALLHRAEYPLDTDNFSVEEQKYNITYSLIGLANISNERLSQRIISNSNIDKIDENYINNLKYDYNKIAAIMLDRASYFGQKHNIMGLQQTVDNMTIISATQAMNRIKDMESVLNKKGNLSPDKYLQLINWAKNGNLANYDKNEIIQAKQENRKPELLASYGIMLNRNNTRCFTDLPLETISERVEEENMFANGWSNIVANEFKTMVSRKAYQVLYIPENIRKGWESVMSSTKTTIGVLKDATKIVTAEKQTEKEQESEVIMDFKE